nr:hypothetical protein [Tanacetum cinerariifolium]
MTTKTIPINLGSVVNSKSYCSPELKEPIEDQPLPADASPTALSPGYVVDSDPEKDEKDPKKDPADYPTDRGNNDDDVEKDEEDKEEEHLAPANSSDVSTYDLETMTTVTQGMSVEEIKQTERQEEKVAENARNKRKWEGNHNGSSNQQNKGHKVPRAHTAWSINKKTYAGSLP